MSTKVYTGLAFTGSGLKDTFRLLAGLKPQLQSLADHALAQVFATRVAKLMDNVAVAKALGGPHPEVLASLEGRTPYAIVADRLHSELRELRQSPYRNPKIDCSVAIHLFVRPSGHRVIARVVEERTDAWKFLCEQPGVCDFSYYNNTDAPEDVSRQAWRSRMQAWSAVDKDAAVFELKIEPELPGPGGVAACITSKEDRARAIARSRTMDERTAELWVPPLNGGYYGVSAVFAAAAAELEDQNSSTYIRYRALEQQLLTLLPEVTEQDILSPTTL